MLIGLLNLQDNLALWQRLSVRRVTAFAMELIPRIGRAQSMDVLTSQAVVAGYKATLLAASALGKFFPMLTTAAGTIPPARVLVIGAGVAGLEAIATARRLGAVVEAFDRQGLEMRGAGGLATEDTHQVLRAMGLPVAPGGVARTADEAVERAEGIGFPVAVKLATHVIVHKTEMGGIFLNLQDEAGVRQAFEAIRQRLGQAG